MPINKKSLPPLSLEQKIELSNHIYLIKNIIYISNLTNDLYNKDILYQKKFFGQYGHIGQIIFDKNNKNENNVIIKFDTVNQAALAILSLNNFYLNKDNNVNIKYYITKFCNYFLNNKQCLNKNCLLLHNIIINDYQFFKIENLDNFNSFQFALDLLNIPNHVFEIIKLKLIGDNYYEKNKKFPKLTIKKLKNPEFIKNIFPITFQESKIKEKNKNDLSENLKLSSEDDSTTNDSSKNKNYSFLKKTRRNKSRFDFVKNNNNNNNSSVVIPEFVLDFLDKSILLNLNAVNKDNEVYSKKNFNDSWINILFGINQKN